MARSNAETVDEYLAELGPVRRDAMMLVHNTILERLTDGYQEATNYGKISCEIPLETFPKTYNKKPLQYAALASQKNYMSLYLMNVYGDKPTETWFLDEYEKTGKKLDMGKSCVRFKTLGNLPIELIGDAIARTPVATFLERYEAVKG